MSNYTSAYKIRYRSLRRLSQDHETHITHGGILVPKSGKLPAVNTKSLLRLETPTGAYFDFPSLIVREIPGQGFIAAFEPSAKESQLALDELIITDGFKSACEAESPIDGPPVAVILIDLDKLYSKPKAAPVVHNDTLDEGPPPLSVKELDTPNTTIRGPEPGEKQVIYAISFQTLLDYQPYVAHFSQTTQLIIPYENEAAAVDDAAELRITLPGKNIFTIFGRIQKVEAHQVHVLVGEQDPAYQSAISFPRTMRGQKRLAGEREEHRGPVKVTRLLTEVQKPDDDKMPLRRRLQRMSMDDKVNLALSGDREVRMALASDGNKAIHHYLLKNARISMDEIVMMARLPTLNPDVLKKIGENPAYTQNPQVVKNLVFNPKTPTKLAVRLIDRLPKTVLNMIAKRTSMNRAIVSAAQKKLGRKG